MVFINFVYELIAISDIVITKCGATTIMEILKLGKVPIISNYIWEQEKGNMEFVRDNNLGVYENKIKNLPCRVNELLFNAQIYYNHKDNIDNLKFENGAQQFSDYLLHDEPDAETFFLNRNHDVFLHGRLRKDTISVAT